MLRRVRCSLVNNLEAWYGESHILHALPSSAAGEVVTLLGRNGVGKTTTLKAIMGIVETRTGSVRLEDRELTKLSSDSIAPRGHWPSAQRSARSFPASM